MSAYRSPPRPNLLRLLVAEVVEDLRRHVKQRHLVAFHAEQEALSRCGVEASIFLSVDARDEPGPQLHRALHGDESVDDFLDHLLQIFRKIILVDLQEDYTEQMSVAFVLQNASAQLFVVPQVLEFLFERKAAVNPRRRQKVLPARLCGRLEHECVVIAVVVVVEVSSSQGVTASATRWRRRRGWRWRRLAHLRMARSEFACADTDWRGVSSLALQPARHIGIATTRSACLNRSLLEVLLALHVHLLRLFDLELDFLLALCLR